MIENEVEYNGNKIVYKEGLVSEKIILNINGVECERIKSHCYRNKENNEEYKIKGNYVFGVNLITSDGTKIAVIKNKWYQYFVLFFPLLMIGFLGVKGGVVGGAIAGGLSAINIFFNGAMIRLKIKTILKTIYIILFFLLMLSIWTVLFMLLNGGVSAIITVLK